ncbi:hypothetical protein [Pontibacter diazotrophicus]|nr:hypothetical protein [Pontibacter diazotrophicus]
MSELTRDAVVVAGGSFYHGMISNIGILLWCATASICLFSVSLLKRWNMNSYKNFLLCGGLLTTMLLLDDLFLLHEGEIPSLLGIRERYIMVTYLILIALFLIRFVKIIWTTSYLVLLSSLGFFGLSVFIDALSLFIEIEEQSSTGELAFLFEDGFKFMGIVGWFYYFASTSHAAIKRGINKKNTISKAQEVLEVNL